MVMAPQAVARAAASGPEEDSATQGAKAALVTKAVPEEAMQVTRARSAATAAAAVPMVPRAAALAREPSILSLRGSPHASHSHDNRATGARIHNMSPSTTRGMSCGRWVAKRAMAVAWAGLEVAVAAVAVVEPEAAAQATLVVLLAGTHTR